MCSPVSTRQSGRSHRGWPNSRATCSAHSSQPTSRPKFGEWLRQKRLEWERNMPITVQIPTALRRHTSGVGSITCAASNLGELFSVLDEKFPDLKPHLRGDKGQVRRFLNIYVNEEDIRFLGGQMY